MKKIVSHIISLLIATCPLLGQDTLTIYFDINEPSGFQHIERNKKLAHPVLKFREGIDPNTVDSVHIHSYCDSTGSDVVNARLAWVRASAGKTILFHYEVVGVPNELGEGIVYSFDSTLLQHWVPINRTPYKSTMQRQFYHVRTPKKDPTLHRASRRNYLYTSKGTKIISEAVRHFGTHSQYVEPHYSDELWKDRKVEIIVFSSPKPEFTQDTLIFEVPSGQSYLNKKDLDSLHNYVREIKRLNITEVKVYSYVDKQECNGWYERSSEDLYIMRLKNATSFFEPDGTDHVIKVESIPYYEIEHQDQSKVEVIITRRKFDRL